MVSGQSGSRRRRQEANAPVLDPWLQFWLQLTQIDRGSGWFADVRPTPDRRSELGFQDHDEQL
ncbi:hypothetical protein [Klenkia soli]|uniref:hypothetical protein n=1 Tax=Klenkia soli TaxID=1052260 RepID=UPI0010424B2F|nr:hypothetical protein [Klenkia soli]